MMNTWNSMIFMKSGKSQSEMMDLAKWKEVDGMWSTSGDWDWCLKLKQDASSPEVTEKVIEKMRKEKWATDTKTGWWKEMSM